MADQDYQPAPRAHCNPDKRAEGKLQASAQDVYSIGRTRSSDLVTVVPFRRVFLAVLGVRGLLRDPLGRRRLAVTAKMDDGELGYWHPLSRRCHVYRPAVLGYAGDGRRVIVGFCPRWSSRDRC